MYTVLNHIPMIAIVDRRITDFVTQLDASFGTYTSRYVLPGDVAGAL